MNFTTLKMSVLTLLTVLTLAGCSSSPSRDVAQEKEHKSDVSKIQDNEYAPHKFHGKRFERNSQY